MDGWVISDSALRPSQFSDSFWWCFPFMHSDLENMIQQISVSSLFSGRGAQLRLADSLAIPTYVKLTLQSPRALIHTTEMERCHVSEFILPSSSEQSVPYASWCISPWARATSLSHLGETKRSGPAMAQHTDELHLSRYGLPLGRPGTTWCACQRDHAFTD